MKPKFSQAAAQHIKKTSEDIAFELGIMKHVNIPDESWGKTSGDEQIKHIHLYWLSSSPELNLLSRCVP